MKIIWSPNYSVGHRERLWVAVHTAESSGSAVGLGNYFARDEVDASSHDGIDNEERVMYVAPANSSWTLRGGNSRSSNLENAAAFASFSRDTWMSQPTRLELNAHWIAEKCLLDDIPIRKIEPWQVAEGQKGVIGHVDYTLGTGDGSHTDPGKYFPWDVVIPRALAVAHGEVEEDDMFTNEDRLRLIHIGYALGTFTDDPEQIRDARLEGKINGLHDMLVRANLVTNTGLPNGGYPENDPMVIGSQGKTVKDLIAPLEAKVDQLMALLTPPPSE